MIAEKARLGFLLSLVFLLLGAGCGKNYDLDEVLKEFESRDEQVFDRARKQILHIGEPTSDRLISLLRNKEKRQLHLRIARLFHGMLEEEKLRDFRINKIAGVLGDVLRDRSTGKDTKHEIARMLGDFEAPTAVRPLLAVLGRGDSKLDEYAVASLGKLGELAVDPLVAERDDPETEPAKLEKITRAMDKVSDALEEQLKDEEYEVRLQAVKQLGKIGTARARQNAVPMLDDANSKVRIAAVKVFRIPRPDDEEEESPRQVLSEQEKKVLLEVSARDDQAMAIEAILILAAEEDARADDLLVQATEFKSASHRVRAIRAMQELEKSKFVGALNKKLEDTDTKVKRAAATALEELDNPNSREPMMTAIALEDQDAKVRLICARALGKMGNQEGVQKLISLLHLEDDTVRVPAIHALGEIGKPAVPALLQCLDDGSLTKQASACLALGKTGSQDAVGPIIAVLQRPVPEEIEERILTEEEEESDELFSNELDVHIAAIRALAEIRNPQALEPLSHSLASSHSEIRWYAQWALHQFGRDSVDTVSRKLKSPDTAGAAAHLLGLQNIDASVSQIAELLSHESIELRTAGADSLGILAARGARVSARTRQRLEDLSLHLEDLDDPRKVIFLRKTAIHALGLIRSRDSLPAMCELLATEDAPDIRFAATQATGRILNGGGSTGVPSELDLLLRIARLDKELTGKASSPESLRRQAVLKLGDLGHIRAISTIEQILENSKPGQDLFEAAALAFLRIAGRKYVLED